MAIREHAISIYIDMLPDQTGLAKVRVKEAVTYGWNGSNELFAGAHLLGLTDRRTNVDKKTGAVALSRKEGYFSGWGFGHRVHHGGPSEVCWNSEWIAREILEISVITRPLLVDVQRFLVQ